MPLTPPNGICASSCTVGPLTWQMPDWIRRATARRALQSRVKTAAESPYSVSLASRTAWSGAVDADHRDDRAEASSR